jgi:hypothetical protein
VTSIGVAAATKHDVISAAARTFLSPWQYYALLLQGGCPTSSTKISISMITTMLFVEISLRQTSPSGEALLLLKKKKQTN